MRFSAPLVLIALALLIYSCDDIYEPISVSGRVVDVSSGSPVTDATVSITSPADLSISTFSNENGEFLFEEVTVDSIIDMTFQATKEGFSTDEVTILAAPDRELVVPDLELRNLQGDDSGGGVSGETGGAAAIVLTNLASEVINIAETGGNVNSAFTFEVQDSTGRPIGPQNAVDVNFVIINGPGGAEGISPTVVRTNENGTVTSNIFAGNRAGNLSIEARIERPEVGLTIRSKPILLTIHGGFPDLEHFSIAADVFNFEGLAINGNRNPITVIVGDKFSNPAKPGTPVYFNTTGGVIQGSGVTDDDGEVEVELISGDPRPSNGFLTIRAHTFDENDQEIVRTIPVLFSGPPTSQNIRVTPSTFDIPANGSQRFNMEITDVNGNVLPFNTTITVTPSDGMTVDGDVDITIPNTLGSGEGLTQFSFTAQDSDEESNERQEVSIRIEVETPGGFTASKTITGFKAKGL
jgi:hypothetical protein